MNLKNKTYLYLSLLIVFSVVLSSTVYVFRNFNPYINKNRKPQQFQYRNPNSIEDENRDKRFKIVWCTISRQEQRKCNNFRMANERDQIHVGYSKFQIECLQAFNKDECMSLLDQEKATLTTLDAGEIFVGGRYYSLVPIAQEALTDNVTNYFSVAVVKKGSLPEVQSLHDLRGKRACFAGVETFAGWIVPIFTLMNQGGMEIIDCNNHVKSATRFFGPSCAVNCLTDKYNPIGDNSDKLCQLCIGKVPGGRCTSSDPYAGYEGAFRCLLESGDIAFVKHNTIPELVSGDEFLSISSDSFELLCKDGSRRPVNDYQNCNWGSVPSDAVVTSSAASYEVRTLLQNFLHNAAKFYKMKKESGNATRNYNDREQPIESDRDRDRYNRFKRQDFNRQNDDRDNNRNDGRYNSRNDDRYDAARESERERYGGNDRNRPVDGNPFIRDPQTINQDQYGVNIDPYRDSNSNRNPFEDYNRTYGHRDEYSYNGTFFEIFNLFESSPRYGPRSNLLFQDAARDIIPLPEQQQTYSSFLGRAMDVIMGVRECQVNKMTLCVTSEVEKEKCIKMRTAMKAQLLKPDMDCYKGHSQIHCMQAIRSGLADITVLDASDVYTAGLRYDLVPIMSEVYNLQEPEYYVVAVGKESDPSTELTYLRGKNTCHGGISTAAGWVYPLAFLISNGWIRSYGCNSVRAAAEYFSKSCVPGAISTEYNTGVPYDNMCDLCHGASFRYCRRDANEDYYGHTGAFRCLVEGGGDVAFVKHTTVMENTGGKRREWWARDNLNDDFELLCPDGTRAEVNEYEKCNLGKVKANAIVTRGGYGYNETHVNAFINLFLYAQTFYGRKTTDEFSFSMFSSAPPYTDLIFQDATTQLVLIHPSQRHYSLYLGSDFMRARRIVDCYAGSASISAYTTIVLLVSMITYIRGLNFI